jgi:hypothetical protein
VVKGGGGAGEKMEMEMEMERQARSFERYVRGSKKLFAIRL